jgi:hypothetical protein
MGTVISVALHHVNKVVNVNVPRFDRAWFSLPAASVRWREGGGQDLEQTPVGGART